MRHLLGIVLAVLLAAALFFAASWGYVHLVALHGASLTSTRGLEALGALAGAGLLLGIFLSVPQVSALATVLPGIVLVAWTVLFAVREHTALRYIPMKGESFGQGFQTLLTTGVLGMIGVAMIIPLFVPRRWRGPVLVDEEDVDEDVMSGTATTGLLS